MSIFKSHGLLFSCCAVSFGNSVCLCLAPSHSADRMIGRLVLAMLAWLRFENIWDQTQGEKVMMEGELVGDSLKQGRQQQWENG